MVVTPGSRVGAYEIGEQIGRGGMGEVFRARDVVLGRSVAIKVLPSSIAADADRLARFDREAQTLASLNHPNIAQLFGLEKGAVNALVMELVEGPTLADRVRSGPIPIDEALPIAAQIADALECAHESGIVHRDLKPANVKVREDGTVKVLDFGLAKVATPPSDQVSATLDNSPTITSPAMTAAGTVLGTAAYMSPEQAKGRVVDRRADIWAFGCVLFEMLSGVRAFDGEDVSDVLAAILRDDPPWARLPAATPPHARILIERCLEKNLKRRLPHIGIARLELSEPHRAAAPPARPRWWMLAAAVAVVALAAALVIFLVGRPTPTTPSAPVRVRAELGVPRALILSTNLALAPDGSAVAFVGQDPQVRSLLHVRLFDRFDAQPLADTDGAQAPFFSPDGQWIGFFAGGALKKVAVSGGRVISICDAPNHRGGWWGDDETIVFATPQGLHRVPASGGTPATIATTAPGSVPPAWPQLLPGGRAVIYTDSMITGDSSTGTLVVRTMAGGETRELAESGRFPRYVPSGHLTFMRGGTMFAAPFDLETLSLKGSAVPVVEGISQTQIGGLAIAAISRSGVLAYQSDAGDQPRQSPIMWLRRTGALTPLRAAPSMWTLPRFSPDGRRLALTISDGRQHDVWVYDWERDILTRVTAHPAHDIGPVWTPDGTGVVFGSNRESAGLNLYWQRADGTGVAQRLTTDPNAQLPGSIDPDGRRLVFHQGDPGSTRQSLMMLPLEGNAAQGWKGGTPETVLGGPFLKSNARISPDGKWLAYAANDTGTFEIYVQPFPGSGNRVQVSSGGGSLAVWSPTKNELYYAGARQPRMIAVPYTVSGAVFLPARPQPWSETTFSWRPPVGVYGPGFDIHPDGERLAVAPASEEGPEPSARPNQIVLLFNFFDELRRLAPAR